MPYAYAKTFLGAGKRGMRSDDVGYMIVILSNREKTHVLGTVIIVLMRVKR
jgi:hypothetical protein